MSQLPSCLMSVRELGRLCDLARDQVVLELGAWCGLGTVELAKRATVVYSVDHHQGDDGTGPRSTLGEFMANLEQYGVRHNVVPIVTRFSLILPMLRPKTFGLVIVDGQHDLHSVEHDVTWARRLVGARGTIAVHDYDQRDVGLASCRILGHPDDQVETLALWTAP